MTNASWFFLVLTIIFLVAFLWTLTLLSDAKEELEDARGRHQRATKRIAELTQFQDRLVQGVMSLIEKTDWMTGRWHGRFNELVALENKRNAAVDLVRKRLWDVPEIREYIQNPRNRRGLLVNFGTVLSERAQ